MKETKKNENIGTPQEAKRNEKREEMNQERRRRREEKRREKNREAYNLESTVVEIES